VPREEIAARPAGLWRWRELLPVADPAHIVSLGEVETPLVSLSNSRRPAGFMPPMVKDEVAAHRFVQGARPVCCGIDGEGARRAAHCDSDQWQRRRGARRLCRARRLEAYCFCPDDTPEINLSEIALQGAAVGVSTA